MSIRNGKSDASPSSSDDDEQIDQLIVGDWGPGEILAFMRFVNAYSYMFKESNNNLSNFYRKLHKVLIDEKEISDLFPRNRSGKPLSSMQIECKLDRLIEPFKKEMSTASTAEFYDDDELQDEVSYFYDTVVTRASSPDEKDVDKEVQRIKRMHDNGELSEDVSKKLHRTEQCDAFEREIKKQKNAINSLISITRNLVEAEDNYTKLVDQAGGDSEKGEMKSHMEELRKLEKTQMENLLDTLAKFENGRNESPTTA